MQGAKPGLEAAGRFAHLPAVRPAPAAARLTRYGSLSEMRLKIDLSLQVSVRMER